MNHLPKDKRPAIFLDRDGVLNDDTGYIRSADDLHLLPGVAEAVRKINESGYLAVVITNQSVVARGYCSEDSLQKIHEKLESDLRSGGAFLDKIYYCPHHPEAETEAYRQDCDCRKPKPGMLLKAADEMGIDLKNSYFIGDNDRDIKAGKSAGVITVGVATGSGLKTGSTQPDYFFYDLNEAVDFITRNPFEAAIEKIITHIPTARHPVIIAIGGNTQSGKSSLSTTLRLKLQSQGKKVLSIALDDWILAPAQRPHHPNVFQVFRSEKIQSDLDKILRGGEITVDGYARHPQRKPEEKPYRYNREEIVIIEGVIALSIPKIREWSHLKVFLDMEEAVHEKQMKRYYQWKGLTGEETDTLYSQRLISEYRPIREDRKFADLIITP